MTNSIYEVCSPAYVEALVAAGGDLNREAELLFDFFVKAGKWERNQYEAFRFGWVRTRKNTMDAWLEACVRGNEKFYEEVFRLSSDNPTTEADVAFNTILSLRLGAQECERAGFKDYWLGEKRFLAKGEVNSKNRNDFDLREGCFVYVIIELFALVFVVCNFSWVVSVFVFITFLITTVLPIAYLFWPEKKK